MSLGYILEVGIRGTLTMIDLSLPVSHTITNSTNNPKREPKTHNRTTVDLILELFSGEISLYVALDALVTTIPIFELVLAKWTGLRIDVPLKNDLIEDGWMCITSELSALSEHICGFESGPCPCRLRPANCHETPTPEQEASCGN